MHQVGNITNKFIVALVMTQCNNDEYCVSGFV